MKYERGSAHVYITLIIVVLVVGLLGFVLWKNFISLETSESLDMQGGTKAGTESEKVTMKTYTSISGSGLTFDYPSSWFFDEPTEQQISKENMKATLMMLTSYKIPVVDGKAAGEASNMCVIFNEMQGDWPFRSKPLSYTGKLADFMVGQNPVILVKNESNLNASVGPDMQIINKESSGEHGEAYIALNNGYFLLATASNDCLLGDKVKKTDIADEIEEASEILKSVRIKN